ncbi:MAG: PKD domain-containing protein, partial [Candidatus Thorarchaeota archaeon]
DPFIDTPQDMNIEAGALNNSIQWIVTEENQSRYYILVNNETVVSGDWNSTTIEFPLDSIALFLGFYNITLLLVDLNLDTATDSVTIVVVDTTAPLIDQPPNIVIQQGDRNTRLIWYIDEVLPHSYTVTRDSTIIMSGSLGSSQVIVNLETLSEGVYTFTLNVIDTSGNAASDTVIVTVNSPPTTTSPEGNDPPTWFVFPIIERDTFLLFGLGFAIVLVACMIFRSSQIDDTGYDYRYN